jgi:mannose-6-phosphate isomerase-like protein (cupin superfamily)
MAKPRTVIVDSKRKSIYCMNRITLLNFVLTAVLISCNEKTDSNKDNHASFDINAELKKANVDSITYYRDVQIDSILNVIIQKDSIIATVGKSKEDAPYLLVGRTKPGSAEIHEHMDDIALIRSGHGTLKTGYNVTGIIKTTDKEPWRNWYYETIKDATERTLSPGDFIIIPAMTAHQYIPDPGDTLTYWTIKVKNKKNRN